MFGFLGGCIGRLVALGLVIAVAVVGWYNRHELIGVWNELAGVGAEPSPELAARADEKLATLGAAGGPRRVALREEELQSLIEYRWSGFLPSDVVDPRIGVAKGRVTLEGSVATARFGRIAELREILAFLPDTAALRAVTSFVPLDGDHVALEVHELGAAGIPVPAALIPTVLSKFRRDSAPGLAPNALAVPLPPGIRSVYVSGDSVVFLANTAGEEE
ncbi:MAG: hypothetical protein ACOC3J_06305 [Gemmatimonadota bacterium]